MKNYIKMLVLFCQIGSMLAMEERPSCLERQVAARGSGGRSLVQEFGTLTSDTEVYLSDKQSDTEDSSDGPISRSSTFAVDIDEELGVSVDSNAVVAAISLITQVERPSSLTEEEDIAIKRELVEFMSTHQSDHHDQLVQRVQTIRTKRSNNWAGNMPQLNVDISDINDGTTWAARKLLEKYNKALNDKVLTEEAQRKAAERTEKRVKIVSGIATGIICGCFVLAQVLPSALSS